MLKEKNAVTIMDAACGTGVDSVMLARPVRGREGGQELAALHRGAEWQDHQLQELPGQHAQGEERRHHHGRRLRHWGRLCHADRGDGPA